MEHSRKVGFDCQIVEAGVFSKDIICPVENPHASLDLSDTNQRFANEHKLQKHRLNTNIIQQPYLMRDIPTIYITLYSRLCRAPCLTVSHSNTMWEI